MFSKIFTTAALASVALAQYDYSGSGSSSMAMGESSTMPMAATMTSESAMPTGSITVHVVQALIDNGKPVFEPSDITAAVGDLVQFQFHPMNHSVVQSSFADPCIPLDQSASANGAVGFFSGFMPVSAGSTVMPTFTIQVNDTKPIWFYCSYGKHCQAGMVGAINPTANKTLSDYTARAMQAPNNVSPGEEAGSGAAPSTISAGATVTGGSPTTMQTMTNTGSGTVTGTNAIATGAASKFSAASSFSLVLGAFAALLL